MSHDHISLYCPKDNVAQYFCVVVIFRHAPFNIAAQFYNLQHIFLWTTQIRVLEPQGTPDIMLRNSVIWHDSNSPLIFPRVALASSSIQLVCYFSFWSQRCRDCSQLQFRKLKKVNKEVGNKHLSWRSRSLMNAFIVLSVLFVGVFLLPPAC